MWDFNPAQHGGLGSRSRRQTVFRIHTYSLNPDPAKTCSNKNLSWSNHFTFYLFLNSSLLSTLDQDAHKSAWWEASYCSLVFWIRIEPNESWGSGSALYHVCVSGTYCTRYAGICCPGGGQQWRFRELEPVSTHRPTANQCIRLHRLPRQPTHTHVSMLKYKVKHCVALLSWGCGKVNQGLKGIVSRDWGLATDDASWQIRGF